MASGPDSGWTSHGLEDPSQDVARRIDIDEPETLEEQSVPGN